MKKTVDTHIVERIVQLSEKIKKFGESEVFANSGITVLQFNILGVIIGLKINTINGIKKKLIISSASLSQTINRMEKAGFIIRDFYEEDRREICVNVTEKGEKLYKELNNKYIKLTVEKMKRIDKAKKERVLEGLDLINKLI